MKRDVINRLTSPTGSSRQE